MVGSFKIDVYGMKIILCYGETGLSYLKKLTKYQDGDDDSIDGLTICNYSSNSYLIYIAENSANIHNTLCHESIHAAAMSLQHKGAFPVDISIGETKPNPLEVLAYLAGTIHGKSHDLLKKWKVVK